MNYARYENSAIRVVLAYKNFAAHKGISHIGLGVSAMNNLKVLRRHGAFAEVWPITDWVNLRQQLNLAESRRSSAENPPITHVVISAPWITALNLQSLCMQFPFTSFIVNCHSNVGFLQADANGIRQFRDCLDLEKAIANFHSAGNTTRLCDWVTHAYGSPCAYLPNLYYVPDPPLARPLWRGGALRIGIFGATRPQKNILTAVAAAVEMSYQLKADTEIWVSTGRLEGGGQTIMQAAKEITNGLPHVALTENFWETWPEFCRTVANMHLLLQPSYTESFNMVTADGIAHGVPSVVSTAIDWAPEHWKADSDNVFDIARAGRALLNDGQAVSDGYKAITDRNNAGVHSWISSLKAWSLLSQNTIQPLPTP